MKKIRLITSCLVIAGLVLGIGFNRVVEAAVPGNNVLVSYNYTNTSAGALGGNTFSRISEDGNIVFWTATSQDVIANYSGTGVNIYKRNLKTGDTSMVNLSSSGIPKMIPTLSGDEKFVASRTGRFVAFLTSQPDVVDSPSVNTEGRSHLYLRDTVLNTTKMVDISSSGSPANLPSLSSATPVSVSDDGRFVAFNATANNLLASNNPTTVSSNPYIKDMQTGQVVNPNVTPTGSRAVAAASIAGASCEGSLYVFGSQGVDLTPEDNGKTNAYIVDMRNGFKIRNLTYTANDSVNVMDMSCNGRYILLKSKATNLTTDTVSGTINHYYRLDMLTGDYELINKSTSGYVSNVTPTYSSDISDNGRVVFYSNDVNLVSPASTEYIELYIRDPEAGTTDIVPVDSSGVERGIGSTTDLLRGLSISARGDYVVYKSGKDGLLSGLGSGYGAKLIRAKIE